MCSKKKVDVEKNIRSQDRWQCRHNSPIDAHAHVDIKNDED